MLIYNVMCSDIPNDYWVAAFTSEEKAKDFIKNCKHGGKEEYYVDNAYELDTDPYDKLGVK